MCIKKVNRLNLDFMVTSIYVVHETMNIFHKLTFPDLHQCAFSIVLVENVPGELSFNPNSSTHLPLAMGLNHLLDQAKLSVEIVSPYWALTSADQGSRLYSSYQVS